MEQVKRDLRICRRMASRLARRLRVPAIVLLLAIVAAAQPGPSEYQVKAAFLLHFTKFVEWPPSAFAGAAAPFAICVLGDDPFGSALDQVVEGETVDGRKVTIQRIKRIPEPKSCQILFIGKSEKTAAEILPAVGPGVLTVGEHPGFLRDGGIIEFALDGHHVRFDINMRAASQAGLTMSARLLKVARMVQR